MSVSSASFDEFAFVVWTIGFSFFADEHAPAAKHTAIKNVVKKNAFFINFLVTHFFN